LAARDKGAAERLSEGISRAFAHLFRILPEKTRDFCVLTAHTGLWHE
jgi:hypothetical protein